MAFLSTKIIIKNNAFVFRYPFLRFGRFYYSINAFVFLYKKEKLSLKQLLLYVLFQKTWNVLKLSVELKGSYENMLFIFLLLKNNFSQTKLF
jgi:hypothetical protein